MWYEDIDPAAVYNFGEEISRGTYGKVYQATNKADDTRITIKKSRESLQMGIIRHVLNEMNIFRNLAHPNIMSLLACYSHDTQFYFIMPYYAKSLHDTLEDCELSCTIISVETIRSWMSDILRALDYMHSSGYLHRDICPKNMMITPSNTLVLCDFSLTRYVGSMGEELFMEPEVHKLWYRAPELLQEKYYDYRSDIWAVGCTMLQIFNRSSPFTSDTVSELLHRQKQVFEGNGGGVASLSRVDLDANTKKLLTDMMRMDYRDRPYAHQLLQYEYFGTPSMPVNTDIDERNLVALRTRQVSWTVHLDRDELYLQLITDYEKMAHMDRLYTTTYLLNKVPNDVLQWKASPKKHPFVEAADNFYIRISDIIDAESSSETVKAEWILARAVNFNTQIPVPSMFIRIYLRRLQRTNLKNLCDNLCKLSLFNGLLRYNTAHLSSAIVWLALHLNGAPEKTKFWEVTGYSATQVQEVVRDICQTMEDHRLNNSLLWQSKKLKFTNIELDKMRDLLRDL